MLALSVAHAPMFALWALLNRSKEECAMKKNLIVSDWVLFYCNKFYLLAGI
jgi:hypothetical protein